MLTVPRKDIVELYREVQKTTSQCKGTELATQAIGIRNVIWSFFGSKCLPDEKVSDSTPLVEPKFKPNDKVIFESEVCTITQVCSKDCTYTLMEDETGAFIAWIDESDLEPYTEPEEIHHFLDPMKMVDWEQRRYELADELIKELQIAQL